jgi:hypothetical protein
VVPTPSEALAKSWLDSKGTELVSIQKWDSLYKIGADESFNLRIHGSILTINI